MSLGAKILSYEEDLIGELAALQENLHLLSVGLLTPTYSSKFTLLYPSQGFGIILLPHFIHLDNCPHTDNLVDTCLGALFGGGYGGDEGLGVLYPVVDPFLNLLQALGRDFGLVVEMSD